MMDHDSHERLKKYQDVLKKCSILQDLTCEEILTLFQRGRFERFHTGEEIVTEGFLSHSVWVVVRGSCEVIKRGQRRDSQLALVEPGHVFGEMSFFDDLPHSATVRVVDRVETIRLTREEYDELAASEPEIARKFAVNIVRVLSERLRRMDEWVCELVEREPGQEHVQEWQEFRTRLHANLYE